jgi:hypothetical protein
MISFFMMVFFARYAGASPGNMKYIRNCGIKELWNCGIVELGGIEEVHTSFFRQLFPHARH